MSERNHVFELRAELKRGWDLSSDVTVEELYQAFKYRLLDELAATRPAGVNVYEDGKAVDWLPLVERGK